MIAIDAINLEKICFRYRPELNPVLEIDGFNVKAGERIFLKGPSGSGKTTLLGLMGGVLEPESGEVTVLGHKIAHLKPSQRDLFRADHIGFIFQMFNLIPYLSVLENVILPCRVSKARRQKTEDAAGLRGEEGFQKEAKRLLSALGLKDETLWHKPVTELSVGQQQRVAAARGLIGGPALLIADEPTSALDTDAREGFLQLLFNQCQDSKTTLVFVSHDSTLGKLFDRVVSLAEINKRSQTHVSA